MFTRRLFLALGSALSLVPFLPQLAVARPYAGMTFAEAKAFLNDKVNTRQEAEAALDKFSVGLDTATIERICKDPNYAPGDSERVFLAKASHMLWWLIGSDYAGAPGIENLRV